MNYHEHITRHLKQSAAIKERIAEDCAAAIKQSIDAITASFRNNGKLLICGNGGSAADAQHIAAEFVVRLSHHIQRPGLPAIALTTDTSLLTAAGNDLGFDLIFSRQVEALGRPGDILLGISTSGNSKNVAFAMQTARNTGLKTIGLLGGDGGQIKDLSDIAIIIPSPNTQHIQEGHITVAHIICELTERTLFE
jgi:D-sedoheptulose 7-phosphate isomerase